MTTPIAPDVKLSAIPAEWDFTTVAENNSFLRLTDAARLRIPYYYHSASPHNSLINQVAFHPMD